MLAVLACAGTSRWLIPQKQEMQMVFKRMPFILIVIQLAGDPQPGHAAITPMTRTEYLTLFKATIANRNSEAFVRLSDRQTIDYFESLTEALLTGSLIEAEAMVDQINAEGHNYFLVHLVDAIYPTYGIMEYAMPGDPNYKGWGTLLVHPESAGYVIYQAPHVKFEVFTEELTLQAFHDNPYAAAAMLAGTHRYANDDHDHDGEPDADVAHETENLFYIMTKVAAHHGARALTPYWFIQFHGAYDRESEPSIVAATGATWPKFTPSSPLLIIDEVMDTLGLATMGVCGWPEGPGEAEDGQYELTATNNMQGRLLETIGLRHSFMHFELERSLRDGYYYGYEPLFTGTLQFLSTLQDTLNSRCHLLNIKN